RRRPWRASSRTNAAGIRCSMTPPIVMWSPSLTRAAARASVVSREGPLMRAGPPARPSPEPVLALRVGPSEPAHARVRPPPVGHHQGDEDLVRTRRVGDAHLHRVEVAPDERGVLAVERHVDRGPRRAGLLRGRDDRLPAADRRPERAPEGGMEEG